MSVNGPKKYGGFTIVEMVIVIIILGIIAIYASSKLTESEPFAVSAGQDQLISGARYAQQVAMMSGPGANVTLSVNATNFEIAVGGTPISLPSGGTSESLPSGVTATAATVSYTSLGETSVASIITLTSGSESRQVCIETSGYAHDC